MKRVRARTLVVQALAILVAVIACGFMLFRRVDASAQGIAPAGAPAHHEAADASAAPADAGDPIDLAIAPDGGVPFHPGATRYKSPFAKPDTGPPIEVKVGMLLNSVDEYDVKTGLFSADFFLSLTSGAPLPSLDLQYPNGDVASTEVIADKPTFKLLRIRGKFKSPPDLRKYPFDSQVLSIQIEDDAHGIDQLRFVADRERAQLARGFRALGWSVSYVEAKAVSHTYPDRFENDDLYYGRYVFELGIERFSTSSAFKVYVPAFVIVLISLLGMWVPATEMEVRSNSGAPMLAAAVLFHFALMQELPETSYLTRADQLMLGVYVSLLLGMLSTWAMFVVREQRVETVFRASRWIVPIGNVLVMVAACVL
ncbi:MAG: hypothetical protein KF819_02700 [Labilithrix sp.]|nr:hypothetical protein [Labilithrix sp.]